jgi:hypothetical protein
MDTAFDSHGRATRRLIAVVIGAALAAGVAGVARAADLTWTDDDWSGGRYASALHVDPEIEPGLLVPEAKLDDIRYLASPTAYQGLYCMVVYHDSLFIAASDYPFMYDGADVLSYDCLTGQFASEYQPYESGLNIVKRFGDTLYLPGPDSMDPWSTPGSIYTYDGQQWLEHASIDSAVHVCDVEVVNNRIFVTTGQSDYTGGVWMSTDGGTSFTRCLTLHPSVDHPIRRFFGAGQYHGRVFVQPDGFPPEGRVIYSSADGVHWQAHAIAGMNQDMHATFTAWGDSLLMAVNQKLFIYNGSIWTSYPLPFYGWRWCRGYHVRQGELYAGGSTCEVFRWLGGADWEPVAQLGVDPSTEEIESIVTYYGRLYVTTSRPDPGMPARIYVSAVQPSGQLVSQPHDFGKEVGFGTLTWDDFRPATGNLARFRVRSSITTEGLESAPFLGPDGTPGSYYTASGAHLANAHNGHRYFQYEAELLCPGQMQMPMLRSVTLQVDSLASSAVPDAPLTDASLAGRGGARLVLGPQPLAQGDRLALRFTLDAIAGADAGAAPAAARVRWMILDPQGRLVRREESALETDRSAAWTWDLRDNATRPVAAGVYLAHGEIVGDASLRATRRFVVTR